MSTITYITPPITYLYILTQTPCAPYHLCGKCSYTNPDCQGLCALWGIETYVFIALTMSRQQSLLLYHHYYHHHTPLSNTPLSHTTITHHCTITHHYYITLHYITVSHPKLSYHTTLLHTTLHYHTQWHYVYEIRAAWAARAGIYSPHYTITHLDYCYHTPLLHNNTPIICDSRWCKRWLANSIKLSIYLPAPPTTTYQNQNNEVLKSSTLGIPTWSPTVVLTEPDNA